MNTLLSPIETADSDKIALWKSDKNLSKAIMSKYRKTSSIEAEKWIKNNSSHKGQILRGIYFNSILVGVARLMFIDFESKNAELGIYIGDNSHKGKGIGNQALEQIIQIGFYELSLLKIYLKVSKSNKRAIKLYEKKGFIKEGILQEHYWNEECYEDVICMAIFNTEKS